MCSFLILKKQKDDKSSHKDDEFKVGCAMLARLSDFDIMLVR